MALDEYDARTPAAREGHSTLDTRRRERAVPRNGDVRIRGRDSTLHNTLNRELFTYSRAFAYL